MTREQCALIRAEVEHIRQWYDSAARRRLYEVIEIVGDSNRADAGDVALLTDLAGSLEYLLKHTGTLVDLEDARCES